MISQLQITKDGEVLDKVEMAIRRLKTFEPAEGYYVAFSGGKDSQCVYHLCKMAGVKFDAHYNVTSVDPPELIRFIRKNYPDVEFTFPRDRHGNVITMWNLIPKRRMPPTRIARYCCEALKESSGKSRVTVTGVRWAESVNRAKKQGAVKIIGKNKQTKEIADELGAEYKTNEYGDIIMNDDNDINRRMVEICYRTRKTLVNPIIDWEEEDVWQFLDSNGIEHCCLYDKGQKRIGCIGCPMNKSKAEEQLNMYPKYKENYIKAFDRMLKENEKQGIKNSQNWESGEDVMRWWLRRDYGRRSDYERNED